MSNYQLSQESGLAILAVWLYEYGLDGVDMSTPGNSPSEIADRWLAERDRQTAERAWDAAIDRAREYYAIGSWDADDVKSFNPYRREP